MSIDTIRNPAIRAWYSEGVDAALTDKAASTNPYLSVSDEAAYWWHEGYVETKRAHHISQRRRMLDWSKETQQLPE